MNSRKIPEGAHPHKSKLDIAISSLIGRGFSFFLEFLVLSIFMPYFLLNDDGSNGPSPLFSLWKNTRFSSLHLICKCLILPLKSRVNFHHHDYRLHSPLPPLHSDSCSVFSNNGAPLQHHHQRDTILNYSASMVPSSKHPSLPSPPESERASLAPALPHPKP